MTLDKKVFFFRVKNSVAQNCTFTWYILHIQLNWICKFVISRKSIAFVAKIANTRLTNIFMTIFAPGERLPIFATLAFCGVAGPPRTFFQDSELHASDVLLGKCFVRTNLINFIVFSRHPPKAQLEDLGTTFSWLPYSADSLWLGFVSWVGGETLLKGVVKCLEPPCGREKTSGDDFFAKYTWFAHIN